MVLPLVVVNVIEVAVAANQVLRCAWSLFVMLGRQMHVIADVAAVQVGVDIVAIALIILGRETGIQMQLTIVVQLLVRRHAGQHIWVEFACQCIVHITQN